jgi:hypothetical protein
MTIRSIVDTGFVPLDRWEDADAFDLIRDFSFRLALDHLMAGQNKIFYCCM